MIIKKFKNDDDVIPTSLDSCLVDMILNLDMSDMHMISETWESLGNSDA